MLEIVMMCIIGLLRVNLVVALIAMARSVQSNSWMLAVLLMGTTGAGLAAVMSGLSGEETSRFVDLSIVLVGLAALPVVVRVVLCHRENVTRKGET